MSYDSPPPPPPPPPTGGPAGGSPPSNYLVPAILSTLFCCLPFGIAAIVFAAQVNGKWASGDIDGAMASAQKAKTFTFVSVGLGLVGIVLYVILAIASRNSVNG